MMAAAWLIDLLPESSPYPALRPHSVVLGFIARHVLAGAVEGACQGYRATRTELRGLVPRRCSVAAVAGWRTRIETPVRWRSDAAASHAGS
jgi:hypothetical protein